MQTTIDLYSHEALLNQNLRPAEALAFGIGVRVPLQFEAIPAPAPPPKPAEGEPEPEPEPDLRHPPFLNGPLPGLIAAWKGEIPVNQEGFQGALPFHAYLLSNHELFLNEATTDAVDPDRIPAVEFQARVIEFLKENLGFDYAAEDYTKESFPPMYRLTEKVEYNSLKRIVEKPVFEQGRTRLEIYLTNKADIQLVVLFVLPEGIDPTSRLEERLLLMLETLRFTGDRPTSRTETAGPTTTF